MNTRLITGLLVLGLVNAMSVAAQNYSFQISGDNSTRIADHASWEQGQVNTEMFQTYNLGLPGGGNGVGLMRFDHTTGGITFADHHQININTDKVLARKILMPTPTNGLHVICKKLDNLGETKSVVILQYNMTGGLIDAYELPALPEGYTFMDVYDVVTDSDISSEFFYNRMRILCLVKNEGAQAIMELFYNGSTHQYHIKQYKPATFAVDKYRSLYYIRAYHYGDYMLGDLSFYGMANFKTGPVSAFCYSQGNFERYRFFSDTAAEDVTGVQMNGSFGDGDDFRIDMAFTDPDGRICIQQKDDLTTLNWRKSYRLPEGKFLLGWGRDGHGTKSGLGMNYFITNTILSNVNTDGDVTTLHYDAANGSMQDPNIYNYSGIGVFEGGGFPNTTYDPDHTYTFIADRYDQIHGFIFGTSSPLIDQTLCTEDLNIEGVEDRLKEETDDMNVETYGTYDAVIIDMVPVPDISVNVVSDCQQQQGEATNDNNNLLSGESTLLVNTESIRLDASGKTIASVYIFGIDGRLISAIQNINSSKFDQQFTTHLVPGIYVVKINYTDHSNEARKVSIN